MKKMFFNNKKKYMKEWKMQKKAELHFIIAGGIPACSKCNSTEKLEVHHLIRLNGNRPNGKIARMLEWEKNMWNVILLCHECHNKEHNNELSKGQTVLMVNKVTT